MKARSVVTEHGIVVGNVYDKYASKNPIVQWMMHGFESSLDALVAQAQPRSIHEVGCGEGHWVLRWNAAGIEARGSDFSRHVIDVARASAASRGVAPACFESKSIYELEAGKDEAELVVCCEVLEHLTDPEAGLLALQRVARGHLVVSVPREPIWRALNMVRGKYLRQWGNTPGHLQHWSSHAFMQLVSRHFDIIECRNPLPWTMLLCRRRR